MKRLLLLSALLVLGFTLSGCMGPSGLAGVAKELATDNATVTVNIGTVYGTARIVRTNPGTNHSATISPDGTVTVKLE